MHTDDNKVVLSGNLGRDPEVGATPKGTLVAKFHVAVNTPLPGGLSKTVWVSCLALGDTAQLVRNSLAHGDRVYVEGALDPYEYLPAGGGPKRQSFRILVDVVRPLTRRTHDARSLSFDFATVQ